MTLTPADRSRLKKLAEEPAGSDRNDLLIYREAVPALLAELEAAEAERGRLREDNKRLLAWRTDYSAYNRGVTPQALEELLNWYGSRRALPKPHIQSDSLMYEVVAMALNHARSALAAGEGEK